MMKITMMMTMTTTIRIMMMREKPDMTREMKMIPMMILNDDDGEMISR